MIISRTPFRVSFFGGGSDYRPWFEKNGGAFLSTTIDKYCYVMCRRLPPFFEVKGRLSWSKIENINTIDEIENPVIRECLRMLDIEPRVDIHYHGDLPARAGLGSSSAFAVALLNALHALNGKSISKRDLAMKAIKVEQDYIGEIVGIQDQTAVAFGGFNLGEIERSGAVELRPVVLPKERLNELQDHLLLFFTGVSRHAAEIASSVVKSLDQHRDDMARIRALPEEALTLLQSDADIQGFGRLLDEGWRLKRSLATAVSTDSIDQAYSVARRAGAIGGKLLGAGGGGFLLLFAPPATHGEIADALRPMVHVPFRFETGGSQIIFYDPDR